MQVNTAPTTRAIIHYPPPYGWQPIISPGTMMVSASNCPPVVEEQARPMDAKYPTGLICEVDLSMIG